MIKAWEIFSNLSKKVENDSCISRHTCNYPHKIAKYACMHANMHLNTRNSKYSYLYRWRIYL